MKRASSIYLVLWSQQPASRSKSTRSCALVYGVYDSKSGAQQAACELIDRGYLATWEEKQIITEEK